MRGHRVVKYFAVTAAEHGIDGRVELWLDDRLMEQVRLSRLHHVPIVDGHDLAGGADPDLGEGLHAFLELSDGAGHVIDTVTTERGVAELTTLSLLPGPSHFALTVDYSSAFGSYSGPITSFYAVEGGRLHAVVAYDARGHAAPVRLLASLRTDWKLARGADDAHDILSAACRPRLGERPGSPAAFDLTLTRYRYDGTRWIVRERVRRNDDWENAGDGQGFPSEAMFP